MMSPKRQQTFRVLSVLTCLLLCVSVFAACGGNNDGKVTLSYDTAVEGVTVPSLSAAAGSRIYPPADPVREGYRFDCWTLGGEEFVFSVMPEKDTTLVAKWSKLYRISFDTGESASNIEDAFYAEGDTVQPPAPPTMTGYKFAGWLSDGVLYEGGEMPAHDLSLTAKWQKAVTISFDTGAPNFTVEPIVEVAGEKISAPTVNRKGYFLSKWLLNGKEFNFDTMPDSDITLTAVWTQLTNLPSMFIDLFDENGNEFPLDGVDRETYRTSRISLAGTDDEFLLNKVAAQFRGRGNGSWNDIPYPKRGYKLKFDKKQSLFGREANKHWVLIACVNFDDPTLSRNYLAYNMANSVFSGIEFATQARWLDLYVNGEYRGVYLLCEHTRVGKGRVDIDSVYGERDTGYLIEYDAYATGEEGVDYFRINSGVKYGFTMHSPDPEDYADPKEGGISKAEYQQQVAYIKDYVQNVYTAALSGNYARFAELVDVDSFVDMYILHELFKNVDCGYSSFYLYKKPGGKLYAGPPWDFDATTNIGDRGDRTPQGIYVADSVQSGSPNCASELYISLYKTAGFKSAVKARWKQLSPEITKFLDERMNDAVYEENKAAMGRNFAKWKNKTQPAAENDWVNDMKTLKKWLTDRVTWLGKEWA